MLAIITIQSANLSKDPCNLLLRLREEAILWPWKTQMLP